MSWMATAAGVSCTGRLMVAWGTIIVVVDAMGGVDWIGCAIEDSLVGEAASEVVTTGGASSIVVDEEAVTDSTGIASDALVVVSSMEFACELVDGIAAASDDVLDISTLSTTLVDGTNAASDVLETSTLSTTLVDGRTAASDVLDTSTFSTTPVDGTTAASDVLETSTIGRVVVGESSGSAAESCEGNGNTAVHTKLIKPVSCFQNGRTRGIYLRWEAVKLSAAVGITTDENVAGAVKEVEV